MKYPKFSVLMSLYIKEKVEYFDECMQSIIRQTVLPNEIVIVLDDKYLLQKSVLACQIFVTLVQGRGIIWT